MPGIPIGGFDSRGRASHLQPHSIVAAHEPLRNAIGASRATQRQGLTQYQCTKRVEADIHFDLEYVGHRGAIWTIHPCAANLRAARSR